VCDEDCTCHPIEFQCLGCGCETDCDDEISDFAAFGNRYDMPPGSEGPPGLCCWPEECCLADADCNDDNPCTDDFCIQKFPTIWNCVNVPNGCDQ